ncbi:B12-binding domain-containing radical SAM protein [Candidatus Omnitrophota bacterium]
MKVLLLYNNFLPEVHWNCLEAQEKNMGAIPPLNLCYVASIIRKCGHEVRLIDLQVEDFSFDELVGYIKRYGPDLLGFTITTYLFHPVLDWIREIKRAVDIPVIVGGFHLSLYPLETMAHPEIDIGLIGGAEDSLGAFLSSFGKIDEYHRIEGLCYRKNGETFINKITKKIQKDPDSIPFPSRDLLKNDLYGNFICKKKNFTAMLTGTGCPFKCKYCVSTLSKCYMRSPRNIVDEIEECYNKYDIREIDFYDQTFSINRERASEICREIIKRDIKIIWTIRTRADLIDRELLGEMKAAGLYRIMYGIESGDQRILDRLGKNEKLSRIADTVRMTHENGITVFGFFMLGCPGETISSLKKTKRFALSMPLDEIQVTRFTLFPGTKFYEEHRTKNGSEDYWRQYVLDKKNVSAPPLMDTPFSPEEIIRYIKSMYLRFYVRRRIIFKKLGDNMSIPALRKYFKAFWDILFT